MDDTSARVGGENSYTHILCDEQYTAYFTRPRKDRLTILEILSPKKLTFLFNESSYDLMEQMKLSSKILECLRNRKLKNLMHQKEVDSLLKRLFPDLKKHTNRQVILEASTIMAYQQLTYVISLLLTDDAPQFKQITELLALC